MSLLNNFYEVNWLSVIVSAIVAFAIGGLWYSALLFGKSWQSLLKLSDEDVGNANMPLIFGLTFLLNLAGALVLDLTLGFAADWSEGLLTGLTISLAWVATSIGINYLFSRKPLKLFLIDAGYFVPFFTASLPNVP
ncbi:MAG: DUF1761 domain-containing protein [Bacteroidales bacterium]|nr:DUF1761 domain-containing protein [Bacteroidales bacterium]